MDVAGSVADVRARVADACRRAGRDPSEVRIVGATKHVPIARVRAAVEAGLEDLGENHARALRDRAASLPGVRLHFIGRLQSNKARVVVEHAAWVHSLEPGRAPGRLSRLAQERGGTAACLVQVDFTRERVGVAPEDLGGFLESLAGMPGIDVRGLMTVPPLGEPPRPWFAGLRELREDLRGAFPGLRELSMGMSLDYEDAAEEGATMVRVGTAIFGARPRRRSP